MPGEEERRSSGKTSGAMNLPAKVKSGVSVTLRNDNPRTPRGTTPYPAKSDG